MKKNIYKRLFAIFLFLSIIIGDSTFALVDSNPNNNILNVTVNVIETKPLELHYYPIDNPSNFENKHIEPRFAQ